jgi:hypothetical protein
MPTFNERRQPIRPERVRRIPRSFSWIDRDLLHHGHLKRLTQHEILLYFFLVLVAGPEGTSFWSHARIGELLGLEVGELLEALRGLLRHDLVAFSYPTFQVLSLPEGSPSLRGDRR